MSPSRPCYLSIPCFETNSGGRFFAMDFGNQLVLADKFLIDYAAGIGYGFTTKQTYFSPSQYGFIVASPIHL